MKFKKQILKEIGELIDKGFTAIDINILDNGFYINPSKIIDNTKEDSQSDY